MTTVSLAALVPLLPFLAAVASLLLGRTAAGFARPLAVLPTLVSAGLAAAVLVRQGSGTGLDAGTRLTPRKITRPAMMALMPPHEPVSRASSTPVAAMGIQSHARPRWCQK